MQTQSRTLSASTKHGSSVHVQTEAAGKVLDEILRKPGPRGATPVAVQNKRRAIGQHNCKPGAAIVACLADNGMVEEFCSALRVLLNPGEQPTQPIADIARAVTRTIRTMGEPLEDVFARRASSRDYAILEREAEALEEESAQLHSVAAHTLYAEPARRVS